MVILEDEPMVARRLERLAREAWGGDLEVEVATSLEGAARLLEEEDVVLLDLNLAGEDGFELVKRAAAEPFQVIVVSANTDRAIEAFELGVVDFVPKPFSKERLEKAFERLRADRREPSLRRLAIADGGRIELVSLDEVVAIHGADDYSEVETSAGRRHLHKQTLNRLEATLPSEFVRVHRSHIVHLRYAVRLIAHGGGRYEVILKNGASMPVGRAQARALRARFASKER